MVLDALRKKTAIIINEELDMSKGKTAAQAAHAIAMTESSGKDECVVLAGSEKEMTDIANAAKHLSLSKVIDAGRTEISKGSFTAVALHGKKSRVNDLTKDLSLL